MSVADPGAARGAGAGPASAPRRLVARLAGVPPALWILVAVGVALRLELWRAYEPAVINLADAGDFAYMARVELFGDPTRTAGYPIFLRAAHQLSSQIEFTIAVQHLLGIATGLLLYATVRRLGTPVWVGALAAAAVLLPLDQIFLEHALMNETVFTVLYAATLYAAVRALDAGRSLIGPLGTRHAWIAAAAVALALAAWTRALAVPLLALLALWFAVAIPGSWRARLGNAALAGAVGGALLIAYFGMHAAETGYFGLSRASGWALYSRTAPFADCARFDPPPGTRPLCETTPVDERAGPDFYGRQPDSPAMRLFGGPPEGDAKLGAFARRTLVAQPLSYLADVGRDFIRYFQPSFQPQDFSGVGYEVLDVARRAPGFEEAIAAAMNAYYADDRYSIDGGVETLSEIQDVVRVHPKLLLLAILLGIAGLFAGRGRPRWGLALLLASSVALLLIPPATAIWSARYAVPANGTIVAAGALGAWMLTSRVRSTR